MMNFFGVLVVCVVCYGGSGFPDDFMEDDKLVIPLKPRAKTKQIDIPQHKIHMKFHQLKKIKPKSENYSNHDSTQSKFSKVQFSASSFSSREASSNGNTKVTEASSKSHTSSISNGTTQLNKTEYIAQAKENKTMNGCIENKESVAAMKAVKVANKNPDGSVQTVGTAVAKSAVSQTANGETKRKEVKAAAMAESIKDAAGEKRSKAIGLAQAEETKSNNGHNNTSVTLVAGESEQVTHGDGKSERKDKFAVLLPYSKIDKSNNNEATGTREVNDNQGTSNNSSNHKIRKGSGNLDQPCTEGSSNNTDTKFQVHKYEEATKETNISENKEEKNDAITKSYDEESEGITGEETKEDEYNDKIATSDDEDESDDTDSESYSDNDDKETVDRYT